MVIYGGFWLKNVKNCQGAIKMLASSVCVCACVLGGGGGGDILVPHLVTTIEVC